jgi:hypothetical protein
LAFLLPWRISQILIARSKLDDEVLCGKNIHTGCNQLILIIFNFFSNYLNIMTLCIAWKDDKDICFSTDSRISISENQYADIGIKIMQIPVLIKAPTPVETGIEEIIYDYKLGMCFCGDTTNALLIKETILEVLQNLQLLPYYTDFSMQGICILIKGFLENISNNLRDGLDWESDIEFLIGGYCPVTLSVRTYKFQLVDYGDHFETMYDEVLLGDTDIELMGTGAEKARELIAERSIFNGIGLLKVLRDICYDDTVPSVGGYLQFGKFCNNNFRIFGVMDYEISPDQEMEYIFAYRGTVFYKDKFEAAEVNFHIAVDFIRPFQDEIDAFWKGILMQ